MSQDLGFTERPYLDTDYEDSSGSDAFRYDMAMHGPAAGAVFSFLCGARASPTTSYQPTNA